MRISVWTDVDLDGAASFLVLKWFLPADVEIDLHTCGPALLKERLTYWCSNFVPADFDQIYFLDLDTTPVADLIDMKNVVIYDHHESHFAQALNYKKAKAYVKACKSTAQLIYDENKAVPVVQLTDAQKRLILMVSDYDSYTLRLKESKFLNYLFWTYTGNRVKLFAEEFNQGFNGFTNLQKGSIGLFIKHLFEAIKDLQFYVGKLGEYKVLSTFCENYHNDIAEHLESKNLADIFMLVNLKQQRVSFRKSKSCSADVSVIAADLCDGGGHQAASGGKITDKFLAFAQTLKQLK